ncbi:MAG TPA: cytochrome B [Oceanospirillaceae bacterium]|nr:cytochrome B [Oceanospirillaceae bacterium]
MPTQYNRFAVVLHWLSAVLVMLLLFAGSQMLAPIDNSDPLKLGALQGHGALGILVGVLTLIRLINIKMRGQPANISPAGSLMARASSLAHKLLYVLILAVAGSGVAMAVAVDLPAVIAGQAMLPESFQHLGARTAHGILTKLLALTILGHIAAALYHHFILKDGLLRRMRFKRLD